MAKTSKTTLEEVGIPAATNTLKQSTKFIKQLVNIGVSQILYLRTSIPEECFQRYGDERLGLMMIKENSESPIANKVTNAVRNAMSAFDDNYLKELNIVILKNKNVDENIEIFEKYTFNFRKRSENEYESNSITLDYTSPRNLDQSIDLGGSGIDKAALHETTQKILIQFIKTIQKQEELPRPAYMTIILAFHDDTPNDYKPAGYCPSSSSMGRALEEETKLQNIGKMKTKFHGFGLQLSSIPDKDASSNRNERNTKGEKPNPELNESVIDMNPGLDTTMSVVEKSPTTKKKASKPSKQSAQGDSGNKALRVNNTPFKVKDDQTPAIARVLENAQDVSQSSLNSTARSSKVLVASKKAISVKDTFHEDNTTQKYVKASKCSRMIAF